MPEKYKARHIYKRREDAPKAPLFVNPDYDKVKNIHSFIMSDLDDQPIKLDKYEGHLCIIVNVGANLKGFAAHNFMILNHVCEKYHHRGLRVLAFPCNQFNEDPGTNEHIKKFYSAIGVHFDVFATINVNGPDAHPLYKYLKKEIPTPNNLKFIKDPYTKFLVGRNGVPFHRLPPGASNEDLMHIITPWFHPLDHEKLDKKDMTVQLPPPLPEDMRPCVQEPWHFEPGILKLI